MTRQIKLEAQIREEKSEKGKKLLRENFIPAVIYGSGAKPENLKMRALEFENVLALAGESHLVSLAVPGREPTKVLIKDVQRDAVKNRIIHVDFYQVDMKKKIITEIPLHFIGESKAVKEAGGILIKNLDRLEVECLPGDLVDYIEVDLSALNAIRDVIRVNDIKLPDGLKHTSEANEVAARVSEPVKEEKEEAPAPVAVEGEQPKEEPAEEEPEAKK